MIPPQYKYKNHFRIVPKFGGTRIQVPYVVPRKDLKIKVLTLGILSEVQMPSLSRRSLISQAKIEGHSRLNCAILLTTSAVATRGLDPPMARGLIDPVS